MSVFAGLPRSSTPSLSLHVRRAVARACSAALFAVQWPMRVHANRQLLERMSCMSDYELADIGLTRRDLSDVSALPLDTEAGAFLAKRANDRRRRP